MRRILLLMALLTVGAVAMAAAPTSARADSLGFGPQVEHVTHVTHRYHRPPHVRYYAPPPVVRYYVPPRVHHYYYYPHPRYHYYPYHYYHGGGVYLHGPRVSFGIRF